MTRILVVEDEKSLSDPLAYLLRREGYEVSVVDNGLSAIDAVEQSPPDLMLLDLMLPGLAGT
ncbi:MAG: response regulator, partial [Pontimonas sp.]